MPEGRLFKSSSNSLGFRLKAFFRSKGSLAAEMKSILSDSESHLMAFVVQRHELRQVPHSAFHSLEATHMKTILSQLNGNDWYKTFSKLDTYENSSIGHLLHPFVDGKTHDRELVVLKVLDQNRINAWVCLIAELLKSRPFPHISNGRVLLAVVREKFVDGKTLEETFRCSATRAPIVPRPLIQAPPAYPTRPMRSRISDLCGPPGKLIQRPNFVFSRRDLELGNCFRNNMSNCPPSGFWKSFYGPKIPTDSISHSPNPMMNRPTGTAPKLGSASRANPDISKPTQ